MRMPCTSAPMITMVMNSNAKEYHDSHRIALGQAAMNAAIAAKTDCVPRQSR